MIDEVKEGGWAELEGNVEEGVALFFAEVADDVGVVVRLLQQSDLVGGDGDKVLEQSLDGDGAALELATENDGAVRAVSYDGKGVSGYSAKSKRENSPRIVSETANPPIV